MSFAQQREIWKQQASRWEHVGPPTRPTPEDGRLLLEMGIPPDTDRPDGLQVAILGVTPEVVQLPWPANTRLQAFDMSAEMIARMWRPNPTAVSHVTQARWQSLPVESQSVNLVAGDGALTALQGMVECREVLSEMARVLRPGGRLVLRCFVRPHTAETLPEVVADVMAGRIRHFGTLKWRLAMALCDSESATVAPMDIRDTFDRLFPDRRTLHQIRGWALETIDTIDSYAGMGGHFTFMTLEQLRGLARPQFTIEAVRQGNYELAERCPTIAFTRRD
ncbi:MAG TPA: methyltransferase domain-containing protein [Porticoccaceae bacterium]